ncbi:aldehyde dehydrogenase family protein [Achromobacter sp.]|uniref:aldehyde dehydrogenase family protein n=1 Tax=Achromobacter sp. TaxID=134375 RepID=UPI002F93E87D
MNQIADIDLPKALRRQRDAFLRDGFPSLETRLDRLRRLADILKNNERDIVEAEAADFGGRSRVLTHNADILGALEIIRHTSGQLAGWMRPQGLDVGNPELEVSLRHGPLGVVGAMTPWNGPVLISYLALVGILAAGNRMMIKLPELTPLTSGLLARELAKAFDESEVLAVLGGADVAANFSRLPFDHLLFTGSTETGRKVMVEAARNLVPVTLELGGKCPVFLGEKADIHAAAPRLAHGKMLFAGQICVTPDYVLCPQEHVRLLADNIIGEAQSMYPSMHGNDDYCAIINDRHFARLEALVEDALKKGAIARRLDYPEGREAGARKFPLTVLFNVDEGMDVMREEIFGPVLPIVGYGYFKEAVQFAQGRDHPLAAYYFGGDPSEIERLAGSLKAGSLTLNDVVCQLFHEQIPFGGAGASGMGRYRGAAGFKTFSNLMPVVTQHAGEAMLAGARPPFAS